MAAQRQAPATARTTRAYWEAVFRVHKPLTAAYCLQQDCRSSSKSGQVGGQAGRESQGWTGEGADVGKWTSHGGHTACCRSEGCCRRG
jgi:hypothetical protein